MDTRREAPDLRAGDLVEPIPGIFEFEEEGERRRRYVVGEIRSGTSVVPLRRVGEEEFRYGTAKDGVTLVVPVERMLHQP